MVAYKDGDRVRLVSRQGIDQTARFREIAIAISKLSARTLVLDGEVAIYDEELRSRFEWLREPDPHAVATPPLLMAFDVLYRDGRLLAVVSAGCGPMGILESRSSGRPTRYFSNSLCGVTSLGNVGLYVEERGTTIPNRGSLELWAFNLGDQHAAVKLIALKPFVIPDDGSLATQIPAAASARLVRMAISMPMYGPVTLVHVEISIDAVSRAGRISLSRNEHTSAWNAIFGGCARPKTIADYLDAVKAESKLP